MRLSGLTTGLLLATTLAITAPRADETRVPRLDRAALLADVDVLHSAYTALHPGLYRYNTPEQTEIHFDLLRRALDRDNITLPEAYLAFSHFAATVRCGHTYANFYNQSKAVRVALFENANRLPFYFRWLDGRMIVTRDLSVEGVLPAGAEILKVDDIPATTLLAGLMPYARADGSNDAKRIALLQVQGQDKYETFDIFLPLVFPQTDRTRHHFKVQLPHARSVMDLDIDAQSYAQRLAARPESPNDETRGWRFDLETDPKIAVLKMPSWALFDSKWDWKAFIRQSFEHLANAPRPVLVIDLRGNEGGLDIGEEILPYLIDKPMDFEEPPPLVRYRKVPEGLAPLLDTWDQSFKDWGDAAKPYDDRYFRLVRWEEGNGIARITPRAPQYAGKVYLLVGASNSSATFGFAERVQSAHLATLVGQPTGGNRRGINGGAFFFLVLPNSGIELDVPLIARFYPGHPPDAGLMPDIQVKTTAADVASGTDAEMVAIRKLSTQQHEVQ